MIIAVDFDGTIVTHKFPEIGDPIPAAIDTLKKLKAQGHKLVLWTCRTNDDTWLKGRQVLTEAVVYCQERGLVFDAVNRNVPGLSSNPFPKIYADWYLDDRAFPFPVNESYWPLVDHLMTAKFIDHNSYVDELNG